MKKESRVKSENFIVIQGWMIKELGLKGNELLVYAIIYGFSQDGVSNFHASAQYLADWTNSTRRSMIAVLKKLQSKDLIVKIAIGKNAPNTYKAKRGVKKVHTEIFRGEESSHQSEESSHQTGEKSSHNNIYNNIDIINSPAADTKKKNPESNFNDSSTKKDIVFRLIGDLNISVDKIIKLNLPTERIKEVFKFARENNKGEGWIVSALKEGYKIENKPKFITKKRKVLDLSELGYHFEEYQVPCN